MVINVGMIRNLYNELFARKFGKTLATNLFFQTRLVTCNGVFMCILNVPEVLRLIFRVLFYEPEIRQIDSESQLMQLDAILKGVPFWSYLSSASIVLHGLGTWLGFLKTGNAMIAGAYACFLFIPTFIMKYSVWDQHKQQIEESIFGRWGTVYNPVSALVHKYDAFYRFLQWYRKELFCCSLFCVQGA